MVVCVNKPLGISSNKYIQIIKRQIGAKKIGHAGTLDPMATGVLVIGINSGTRQLADLVLDNKQYIFKIKLGTHTDTYDTEGKVLISQPVSALGDEKIKEVVNSFKGKQNQTPPIFSAIKVNGKKLYEYARNSEKIDVKQRAIEIYKIEFISFIDNEIKIMCHVSKGTYVRSLAVDIATKLGQVGHVSYLQRIASGSFKITDCLEIKDIVINE